MGKKVSDTLYTRGIPTAPLGNGTERSYYCTHTQGMRQHTRKVKTCTACTEGATIKTTYVVAKALLGLAKALEQEEWLAADTTDELPAGTAVNEFDELKMGPKRFEKCQENGFDVSSSQVSPGHARVR